MPFWQNFFGKYGENIELEKADAEIKQEINKLAEPERTRLLEKAKQIGSIKKAYEKKLKIPEVSQAIPSGIKNLKYIVCYADGFFLNEYVEAVHHFLYQFSVGGEIATIAKIEPLTRAEDTNFTARMSRLQLTIFPENEKVFLLFKDDGFDDFFDVLILASRAEVNLQPAERPSKNKFVILADFIQNLDRLTCKIKVEVKFFSERLSFAELYGKLMQPENYGFFLRYKEETSVSRTYRQNHHRLFEIIRKNKSEQLLFSPHIIFFLYPFLKFENDSHCVSELFSNIDMERHKQEIWLVAIKFKNSAVIKTLINYDINLFVNANKETQLSVIELFDEQREIEFIKEKFMRTKKDRRDNAPLTHEEKEQLVNAIVNSRELFSNNELFNFRPKGN